MECLSMILMTSKTLLYLNQILVLFIHKFIVLIK